MQLYKCLKGTQSGTSSSASYLGHEGPVFTGYDCGNIPQVGCLTTDPKARIHSCEKGMGCPAIDQSVVWIRPIITRTNSGEEIAEIGVGGGWHDLDRAHDFELRLDEVLNSLLRT
jgi:DNA cross-link repair 1C protein